VLARQTRIGNIWFVPAAFISMSRVHVRLHHASDLAGGALIGSILGKLTHRFIGK
jgi:membrane-associated phospholipid phosphatase